MTSFRNLFGRKPASTSPPGTIASPISRGLDPDIRMMGSTLGEDMRRALATGYMLPSFSQLGEDGTLRWLFGAKKNGFYVDVGCHYPHHYSNTAFLHVWLGWSGLNIDIDKKAIAAFEIARPRDTNINSAVGSTNAKVECTIYDNKYQSTINTILPGFRTDLPHHKYDVQMRPLSDLLDQYLPEGQLIEFLNIDAEGCDFDVLTSNDWSRYKPKAIAVEMPGHGVAAAMASETYALLTDEGYDLLSHTVVTSIFTRRG